MSQAISAVEPAAQTEETELSATGRRFDREPAAWVVSLLVHFAGMLALGTLTLALPQQRELVELAVNTVEDIDVDATPREFASSDRQAEEIGAAVGGRRGRGAGACAGAERGVAGFERSSAIFGSRRATSG